MLNLAQMEERYYTNNYAYNPVSAAPAVDPNGWSNFAGDSMAGRKYDITVTVPAPLPAPANSYSIQAVPYANNFVDTDCQTLTLDYMGVKGLVHWREALPPAGSLPGERPMSPSSPVFDSAQN